MNSPKIEYDGVFGMKQACQVVISWNKADAFPWMKRRTVDYIAPRIALVLSAASLLIHLVWALITHCSANFQRGGAVIVFAAATAFAYVDWYKETGMLLDGGKLPQIYLFNPYICLPVLAAIGTVIWG